MTVKLQEGDIFSIEIDNDHLGYGQIVAVPDKNKFMIIVFKNKRNKNEKNSLQDIINDEILLLGYTLDAKFYHKNWIIVGNEKTNLTTIRYPKYKLGSIEPFTLLDHNGREIKKIGKAEAEDLAYLAVIAPVRYENALKAFHEIGEWSENYNKILYKVK